MDPQELHKAVQRHDERLADHDSQLAVLHEHRKQHKEMIDKLGDDIEAFKTYMPKLATREDVNLVHAKIDEHLNFSMRTVHDALNAQPAKISTQIAIWKLAIGVIAAIVAIVAYVGH